MIDLGTFAGPGGWATGAAALGIPETGIEWDESACLTRIAAGHSTVRADVSAFPVDQLSGKVRGYTGSPPCKLYSSAGTGIGRLVLDVIADAIPRMFAGDDCRAEVRAAIHPVALEWRQAENEGREPHRRWTAERVEAAARDDAFQASLVLEPARYIAACHPEWIALEQVPAVLPLWQVYASELARMGYSTWTGILNAADYGVPQIRERAFLIASSARRACRPEPTHYDPRKKLQLWGEHWVTMASALGWGMTDRPFFTLPTAGGNRGGADVGGSGARKALHAERDSGRWVFERPATTLQCDPRLFGPHAGSKGESHSSNAVRLTPAQAAALQSFPPGYPFAGTPTKAHQQIGNAVPPLLAIPVLGVAAGIDWRPVAEAYSRAVYGLREAAA